MSTFAVMFLADDFCGRPIDTIHRLKFYKALRRHCDALYADAHLCNSKAVEKLIMSTHDVGKLALWEAMFLPSEEIRSRLRESRAQRNKLIKFLSSSTEGPASADLGFLATSELYPHYRPNRLNIFLKLRGVEMNEEQETGEFDEEGGKRDPTPSIPKSALNWFMKTSILDSIAHHGRKLVEEAKRSKQGGDSCSRYRYHD